MKVRNDSTVEPLRKPVPCPTCDQKSRRATYPFCSKRCQELDMHGWFSERYRVREYEPRDGFDES